MIAKQRHGPIGTVKLFFEGEFTRFGDLEPRDLARAGRLIGTSSEPQAGQRRPDHRPRRRRRQLARCSARASPPAECAAVVKADAYGLGADQVGAGAGRRRLPDVLRRRTRRRHRRCARPASPGDRRSTCWTARPRGAEARIRPRTGCRPVLNSLRRRRRLGRARAAASPTPPPAALHVDTGMSRLGLTAGGDGAARGRARPAGRRRRRLRDEPSRLRRRARRTR